MDCMVHHKNHNWVTDCLFFSSPEGDLFFIDKKVLTFKYVLDLMCLMANSSSATKRRTDSKWLYVAVTGEMGLMGFVTSEAPDQIAH